MVKKIRVIDEPANETMSDADVQRTMLELAKAMDWKLWELLQTIQRLEKKLAVVDHDNDDD